MWNFSYVWLSAMVLQYRRCYFALASAIHLFLLIVGYGDSCIQPGFRQGNSYRIMYVHVPAAVVALADTIDGVSRAIVLFGK